MLPPLLRWPGNPLPEQHRPGDSRQLVSDGNDHLGTGCSRFHLLHPLTEAAGVVLHSQQHSASAMNEHAAQVHIAAFADAVELCLAPGGVLSRHQSELSGKLAPLTKR